MQISDKLLKIAKQLEESSDELLAAAETNPKAFGVLASGIAESALALERTANDLREEVSLSEEDIEEIVTASQVLDDYGLTRSAEAIDNLLSAYVLQKQAQERTLEQLGKMRAEYHAKMMDPYYRDVKAALDSQNRVEQVRKAVKQQVKRFEPLEAALSTRYSPDMPGVQLIRISDSVYQCPYTGKMYDYKAGYTTNKGNKIPGTSVEHQIPEFGQQESAHSLFSTRESIVQRMASEEYDITKTATHQDELIGSLDARKALLEELKRGILLVMNNAPEYTEDAIDEAIEEALEEGVPLDVIEEWKDMIVDVGFAADSMTVTEEELVDCLRAVGLNETADKIEAEI